MPYELLLDIGTAGFKRDFEFETVTADFGDGWYAAAILNVTPIRTWTLVWSGIYHDPYGNPKLIQAKTSDGANFGTPVSRLKYLQDFFARRMGNGNDPFYMVDPADLVDPTNPTYNLCRLDVNTISFNQSSSEKQRWDFSARIRSSRYPGVPNQIIPGILP